LPLRDDILSHIRGDQYSVAVRVPSDKKLIKFLSQVGPVVSTSCNISGQPAIVDHKEAEQTFGEQIDYYLNTKDAEATASTIIKIIR